MAKARGSHKVLVANRSEIACRVFQAAREMGIVPVGIVAPGDEQARHVTLAPELASVPSYLDSKAVVEAASRTGATLVHPGYGFLSERPVFARAVEAAGMTFVGPRAETMEALGEKIASKELAEKSGVPTLPWAKVPDGGDLGAAAKKVGFPLLLKASAGGGGKGMRRVNKADELTSAAESARAEALAAFGDGTLFLERLLDQARHIEVQVFGDGQGGGVHLFARDCTLQRRHQKVWEEAPAHGLSDTVLKGLYDSALKLTRAVKYRSAGTLEFLVEDGKRHYFLEMNTRLQVEHPVTEWVTGVDLVHAQLSLAMDSGFKLAQPAAPMGHSIEVRIYAEDPAQGFMPTPGRVERLIWPTGPGIRIDSGIEEGQEVTTLFDPMLAKIAVWAPTRDAAIERLKYALDETVILGVGTNQRYLRALCDEPAVRKGDVHTRWLETSLGFGAPELAKDSAEALWISGLRASGLGRRGAAAAGKAAGPVSPWSTVKGDLRG
ncbi:MAG TPA: biotin carboxylase N-terminal domain-containing protein [Bdellovibrionota bacterium]|nr:biotin carboxylase N-terminal domain-containing protein [Bdellovibrionota bacterium]